MSDRPAVGILTARAYDGLPQAYRDADAPLGYPLLRYLSGVLDQLDAAELLRQRFTYTPADDDTDEATATADLVDPARANARWLPWLAQLLGVPTAGRSVAEQRAALADPSTSWDHGTPGAIAEAAARTLTDTKRVDVVPHYEGNPFVIGLGTLAAETESADTFAELKVLAPRWADLQALGSFANARAPYPARDAEAERPAGYALAHHTVTP